MLVLALGTTNSWSRQRNLAWLSSLQPGRCPL